MVRFATSTMRLVLGVALAAGSMTLVGCNKPDDGEKCASCDSSRDCNSGLQCISFSDNKKRCAEVGWNECNALRRGWDLPSGIAATGTATR